MAPKRTKAKSGSGYSRVETNIYREVRSDAAVRFRVSVYPLKPVTKTCDLAGEADGLDWARGVRLELLRRKRSPSGSRADQSPVYTPNESARQAAPPSAVGKPSNGSLSPEAVTVDAILTWYEKHGIPLLSTAGSRSTESSRVRKLRAVFGPRTLEDLTEVELEAWIQRRLRGEGGGARSAWRNERHRDTRVLTKDQRRRLRASIARGDESAANDLRPAANPVNAVSKVTSPSTQTVRHELRVLRSACKSFFRGGQWAKTRGWLAATPLMTIALPAGAQPRQRRISADEEQRLLKACHSPVARFAIRFALSETCRRSELVLLLWEDVDLERSVLHIRRPDGQRKSKTRDRLLPLTPECIELLNEMGPRDEGPIFPISAYALSQAFRRAADRAGLYDLRFHDTRREAVSALAEANVPTEHLMVFTGHFAAQFESRLAASKGDGQSRRSGPKPLGAAHQGSSASCRRFRRRELAAAATCTAE